ncbi:MAG: hypothetical protein FGM27_01660 [Candidatus Omnitrophica bacterium]|nr:hypothetical protein [Candidatus Omnitrophota bacterium]
MKLTAVITLLSALLFAGSALAQDPAAVKSQADSQVVAASKLMERAMTMLQQSPMGGGREAAVALLAEAGQMFEKSAGLYKALYPNYASKEDVENSIRAMQVCIQRIQEIRRAS